MAEGGWDVQMEESDFMGINTVAPEEQPRLHTERLVSSRSRDSERKLSFPERGFRQQQQQPPAGMQLVRAAAVAADPFGEQEEDVEQEEWRLEIAEEELVQARNPHPVAPVAGFADRQHLDGVDFLDHRARNEVALLVSAVTNGATPMLMACRNGHLDVVEYLVERCGADIEQAGSVTFDGETIEGAPPLWVAAAAGHVHIVRFLVRAGASVNCTTKTNSTPLRAACFDGHFEIVKYLIDHGADMEVANRHGHTCLMIACYKGHLKIARYLIELAADVNRKSVKGNTALHDCAESGSLEILQLLLSSGAKMVVDSYGMTPLLAAAVSGHTHIVEYIVHNLDTVSRKEKIDALELLGATFVDRKRDMLGALEYWKQAMQIRYESGVCSLPKPQGQSPIAAFENTLEATTVEQLEEAVSDPDGMRMQALLVRERILGAAHPETSYYIRYRGAVYADTGNFNRCIRLWMYALEMQQSMLEPLSPMTNSSLLSFAELFSFMMAERDAETRNNNNGPAVQSNRQPDAQQQQQQQPPPAVGLMAPQRSPPNIPPLSFSDVMAVLSRAVREIRAGTLQLSKVAAAEPKIQPALNSLQDHALRKSLYDLVRLNARSRNGYTLLHLACTRDSTLLSRYPVCSFPSTDVIRLLLDVGADPESTDHDGNTALHILAQTQPCPSSAVSLVLQRGCHLDQVNLKGQSFAQLMQKVQPIHEVVNTLQYTSLKCLCARVIRQHRLLFKGLVPQTLQPFVLKH
ncbi:Protein fem-1 B [Daphnia magna]|uniref:Protein fem-1 B n=1 Tax=Daphnia magna TaxID=35525 RepID=A0A164XB45_9CRUS|nr:Protein fem-1 B [Daphnia magna]